MTTDGSASRFHRRRLVTRLRAWWSGVVVVVAVSVLGGCAWVVFLSSWLAADDVAVSGERTLSARDVQAAAAVPLGTPLARIDLDAISQRVAHLAAVRSVAVHRAWPHTVTIAITERNPVAAIHRDGAWWVLDDQGVLFRRTAGRAGRLPVIAVPGSAPADALSEAAGVVAALPADILAETKRLTAGSMDSITLRLKGKSEVFWGSAAQSDRKVEVLKALLLHGRAGVYDVSVPEQPTTSG